MADDKSGIWEPISIVVKPSHEWGAKTATSSVFLTLKGRKGTALDLNIHKGKPGKNEKAKAWVRGESSSEFLWTTSKKEVNKVDMDKYSVVCDIANIIARKQFKAGKIVCSLQNIHC